MTNVTLSGGDLGGHHVDGTGWPINSIREFRDAAGRSYFYRNDPGDHAVFVGEANPLKPTNTEEQPPITTDTTIVTIDQ